MRSFVIGFVLLVVSASVLADTRPSKQLVEQYIKQAQAEQQISAQVEGYAQQLSANADPEAKAQIVKYLNATIGWNTIKDQYATLVEKTYTAEELKAALAFLKSPVGSSITKKNQRFAQDLAALIAMNVQQVAKQLSASSTSDGGASSASGNELAAINVEEQNQDGRVYFTGTIENHGKRPARGVQVEVNLFLAGKFVDQYTTYVSGVVVPGSSRYFKVSCGCKDSPPAKHDSFAVNVVEGY